MVEDLINFNFDNVEGSSNQISKEWFDRYPLIDNDESTHYSDHIPQNKKRLLKNLQLYLLDVVILLVLL